jgi:hypothetical protein
VEQHLVILLRLGVARENQHAPIGGGHPHIHHLDGGHFLQHRSRSQFRCQSPQALSQGDVQTIGQEGYKDVRFDARVLLVKNRSDRQIAFQAITLVFDKGNNSKENLRLVDRSGMHFIGSLVPTQHPDLLAIRRQAMRRLEGSKLPAVWAYRMPKVLFGVQRTVLVTFNQKLYRAQTKTLSREIHKRERKLEKLQNRLRRRRPADRGKKPSVAGVQKRVQDILCGRHMADLFRTQIHKTRQGLPRLQFHFRKAAYQKLCSTLLGKTILFTDHGDDWSDEEISDG